MCWNIKNGLNRDLNPGPLAPKARIIPLDHWALKYLSLNISRVQRPSRAILESISHCKFRSETSGVIWTTYKMHFEWTSRNIFILNTLENRFDLLDDNEDFFLGWTWSIFKKFQVGNYLKFISNIETFKNIWKTFSTFKIEFWFFWEFNFAPWIFISQIYVFWF